MSDAFFVDVSKEKLHKENRNGFLLPDDERPSSSIVTIARATQDSAQEAFAGISREDVEATANRAEVTKEKQKQWGPGLFDRVSSSVQVKQLPSAADSTPRPGPK